MTKPAALDGVGRAAQALVSQASADRLNLGDTVAALAAVGAYIAHHFRVDPIAVIDEFRSQLLSYYDRSMHLPRPRKDDE